MLFDWYLCMLLYFYGSAWTNFSVLVILFRTVRTSFLIWDIWEQSLPLMSTIGNRSADIGRKWGSCSVHSLTQCLFTAEQSIYTISTVLSLHNHIKTDLKSHTCCNAIWLEAGSISSYVSPGELYICTFCWCMCASLSVTTYLKSPVSQAELL